MQVFVAIIKREVTQSNETRVGLNWVYIQSKICMNKLRRHLIPHTRVSTISNIPHTRVSTISNIPHTRVSTISNIPHTRVSNISNIPHTRVSTISNIPHTRVSTISNIPHTRVSTIRNQHLESLTNKHMNKCSGDSLSVPFYGKFKYSFGMLYSRYTRTNWLEVS